MAESSNWSGGGGELREVVCGAEPTSSDKRSGQESAAHYPELTKQIGQYIVEWILGILGGIGQR